MEYTNSSSRKDINISKIAGGGYHIDILYNNGSHYKDRNSVFVSNTL